MCSCSCVCAHICTHVSCLTVDVQYLHSFFKKEGESVKLPQFSEHSNEVSASADLPTSPSLCVFYYSYIKLPLPLGDLKQWRFLL